MASRSRTLPHTTATATPTDSRNSRSFFHSGSESLSVSPSHETVSQSFRGLSVSRGTISPSSARTKSRTASVRWTPTPTNVSSITSTVRFTETASFLPTPAVLPDVSFEFSQMEIIMFGFSAFVVLVSCLCSANTFYKHSKKASRMKRETAAAAERERQFEAEQKRVMAKKTELDDMDVAFDDFLDDTPTAASPHHDPLDYVLPNHLRSEIVDDEYVHLEDRLRKTHSVYGVSPQRAHEEVKRRVQASDFRIERIERSMRLQREVLRGNAAGDGASITRGLVPDSSAVEVMHTSSQVAPLELEELPWLSSVEVDGIRSAQDAERKEMIKQSGRDPKQSLVERKTLELSGTDHSSPHAARDGASNVSSQSFSKQQQHVNSRGAASDRSTVVDSVLRTAQRVNDVASNASFIKGSDHRGSFHRRFQQSAQDATTDIASNASSGQLRGGGARQQQASPAAWGAESRVPTWSDLGKKITNAELYQFSQSPMERMRNVRNRVDTGPLRGRHALPDDDHPAQQLQPSMQWSVDLLPDPDEGSFVGIDLDFRLLDADL